MLQPFLSLSDTQLLISDLLGLMQFLFIYEKCELYLPFSLQQYKASDQNITCKTQLVEAMSQITTCNTCVFILILFSLHEICKQIFFFSSCSFPQNIQQAEFFCIAMHLISKGKFIIHVIKPGQILTGVVPVAYRPLH